MRQLIIKSTDSSTTVVYGCLEEMVRQQAQSLIQRVLEEEVEARCSAARSKSIAPTATSSQVPATATARSASSP